MDVAPLRARMPLTGAEDERLAAAIRHAPGFPFRIDFTYPPELSEPGASPKFEEFIDRIDSA